MRKEIGVVVAIILQMATKYIWSIFHGWRRGCKFAPGLKSQQKVRIPGSNQTPKLLISQSTSFATIPFLGILLVLCLIVIIALHYMGILTLNEIKELFSLDFIMRV